MRALPALLLAGLAALAAAHDLLGAVAQGNHQALTAALAAGADPNEQDYDGRTALTLAVTAQNHRMMALLLNSGADPNVAAESGHSPLMYAAAIGDYVATKALLRRDADVHQRLLRFHQEIDDPATSKVGFTPLHFAAESGNAEVIEILVDAGADTGALDDRGYDPAAVADRSAFLNATQKRRVNNALQGKKPKGKKKASEHAHPEL